MATRETLRSGGLAMLFLVGIALAASGPAQAAQERFPETLARVDEALQSNPNRVASRALVTCRDRRDNAALLFRAGEDVRARRALAYCFNLLGIPAEVEVGERSDASEEAERAAREADRKRQARAARESERALALEPDLANGLELYRSCAACHGPEAWGLAGAGVPQLAGQHRRVLIEQLADIRAGNRANQIMLPYASAEAIGGAQALSDVTGYIGTLEITTANGKGPGTALERGERLYAEHCVRCHDLDGEGDDTLRIPRIQAQHYHYLVAQFEQIRAGARRIQNEDKLAVAKRLDDEQIRAIMDFVSRLMPPEPLRAPPEWYNPDLYPPPVAR